MRIKTLTVVVLLGFALGLTLMATAGSGEGNDKDKDKDAAANVATASHASQDDPMRLEGEKRFHANCGRCHAAPPKFPPRMMATIIRHMRVRAIITDQDMRYILHYMTQ